MTSGVSKLKVLNIPFTPQNNKYENRGIYGVNATQPVAFPDNKTNK
jgi:hypothetical protein